MKKHLIFYKKNRKDKVWWVDDDQDTIGEFRISFDKKKIYYLFRDYWKMTPEERELFNKENPYWAEFFGISDSPTE